MKKIIEIEGMTCMHCQKRVENTLKELAGVISVKVDLNEKKAEIELESEIENKIIIDAVDDAGYSVTRIS